MSAVSTDRDPILADHDARVLACSIFDRPFVLEAGAGTGKTTALVNRIASWCLLPGWSLFQGSSGDAEAIACRVLEGLVAITFTEAAAAEMASRVARAFASIEAGELPPGLGEASLPETRERIVRARALLSGIDRLVVTTIHAFCRRLLVRFPFESGVAPGFQVDADFSVLRGVAREVMEEALATGLQEEDPSLLFLARRGILPEKIEEALITLAERGMTEELLARDPLSPEAVRALRARVEEACRVFANLFTDLGARTNAHRITLASADVLARTAGLGDDLASLDRLMQILAESFPRNLSEHLRKGLGRGDFNKGEEKIVAGLDRDAIASSARDLSSLLENLEGLDTELLCHARKVLQPLLGRVQSEMRHRGVSSFADLLSDTVRLLTEKVEVRTRLRSEIRQLLVDEFQDTDGLQCRIIELLALGGEGERPGLFLVGDPKQSIYGWRSADLRAYDEFVDRIRARGGEVRGLSMNFRSPEEMLDEVGRVCSRVMTEKKGIQPPYQRLVENPKRSQPRPTLEAPAVEYWSIVGVNEHGGIHPSPKGPAEIAAQAVAEDILSLEEKGVRWEEIALLVRAAPAAQSYLQEFRERGIPYHVDREIGFYRKKEIVDAVSLLRCVLDPNDHLSLVAFLRSPSVGVPDAAWIPLWTRRFPESMSELTGRSRKRLTTLHEIIDGSMESVPETPGIDRIAGWPSSLHFAVEAIAELRHSARHDPAPRFVERLRRTVQIETTEAARHLGRHRVANLARFFRTLSRVLQEKSGDPMAVMRLLRSRLEDDRRFDEGQPREGIEAVQVMTIHKAKGLDFEHVYLGDTFRKSGKKKGDDTVRVGEIGSSNEEEGDYSLLGARTLGFDRLEKRQREVETAERVRLLYVAMTRAKTRLVVPGLFHRTSRIARSVETAESLEALVHLSERMAVLYARNLPPGQSFCEGAVRFLTLAAGEDTARRRGQEDDPRLPGQDEVRESARRFRSLVEGAELRSARPFRKIVTEEAREEWSEERARRGVTFDFEDDGEGSDSAPPLASPRGGRELALAVGTAVHRVLERIDPRLPLEAAIQREENGLIAFLSRELPEGDRAAALERCRDLLDRFARGPLGRRFTEIAPTLLARELPLLACPGEGDLDPVLVLSGTIDLLYRDPDTGHPVVVDYKTDSVTEKSGIDDLGRRYLAQGHLYAEAVRDALGLDKTPRFELWLLVPGKILRTDPR